MTITRAPPLHNAAWAIIIAIPLPNPATIPPSLVHIIAPSFPDHCTNVFFTVQVTC